MWIFRISFLCMVTTHYACFIYGRRLSDEEKSLQNSESDDNFNQFENFSTEDHSNDEEGSKVSDIGEKEEESRIRNESLPNQESNGDDKQEDSFDDRVKQESEHSNDLKKKIRDALEIAKSEGCAVRKAKQTACTAQGIQEKANELAKNLRCLLSMAEEISRSAAFVSEASRLLVNERDQVQRAARLRADFLLEGMDRKSQAGADEEIRERPRLDSLVDGDGFLDANITSQK